MRPLVALLLVAAGLSGCASPDPADTQDIQGPPAVLQMVFRTAVDLGSKAGVMDLGVGGLGTSCQDSLDDGDCGLGEPSIEVDGAGTIYVSGVCCLTVAPPVYVSRDGGDSFQTLATDTGVREAWGVEGDFAIDQEGRVYFSDIEVAATFQMTVWEPDGTFVRHTKWPAPPLVDRDWVRAEGDGTLYYVYNTGTDTNVYKSSDGGATWSPTAIHSTGFGLGNAAILPGHALCIVGGGAQGMRLADCTHDGGATWQAETTATPTGGSFPVPTFDEAGRLYVVGATGSEVFYSWREPMQSACTTCWHDGGIVSPNGTHRMPWAAGGSDGALALAWYGTNDTQPGPQSEWFLWTAVSQDATAPNATWHVAIADPEPVFVGELGRDLLDFLQVDLGPDGALHIAYSKLRPGQAGDGNEEQLHYVRSEPIPELAMQTFWLGPR